MRKLNRERGRNWPSDLELEAIRRRDRNWKGGAGAGNASKAARDRRTLLAYVAELERTNDELIAATRAATTVMRGFLRPNTLAEIARRMPPKAAPIAQGPGKDLQSEGHFSQPGGPQKPLKTRGDR